MAVTRDVEPTALRALLEDPPRATVAFVRNGLPDAVPARVRMEGSQCRFAVSGAAPDLAGAEVVVMVDGGQYWFELRGLSVRGVARLSTPPGDPGTLAAWYLLEPRRTLAWDYASVREA